MNLFWALVGLLLGVPLSLALPRVWPLFAGDGDFVVFAGAAGGGAALTLLVLRFVPVLAVLEHELTHMLVALLHLRRPLSLSAGARDGEVTYTGQSAMLIRLAPYVLPTFTLGLLLAAPLFAAAHHRTHVLLCGVTWGFHVTTLLEEARPHQPDLKEGGLVRSFVALLGLGVLFYCGAALWAVGDFDLVRTWVRAALDEARGLAAHLGV
ncbi:MAG: hypothetical protein ACOYM9_02560 [Bradymonadia bacterium]